LKKKCGGRDSKKKRRHWEKEGVFVVGDSRITKGGEEERGTNKAREEAPGPDALSLNPPETTPQTPFVKKGGLEEKRK